MSGFFWGKHLANAWTLGLTGAPSMQPVDQEPDLSVRWPNPGNKGIELVGYSSIHLFLSQTLYWAPTICLHCSKGWGFIDKDNYSLHCWPSARPNGILSVFNFLMASILVHFPFCSKYCSFSTKIHVLPFIAHSCPCEGVSQQSNYSPQPPWHLGIAMSFTDGM